MIRKELQNILCRLDNVDYIRLRIQDKFLISDRISNQVWSSVACSKAVHLAEQLG